MGTGMEENRIRQIKAVVTWTVLWMAVLVLLSMVCVASSGLLPAETVVIIKASCLRFINKTPF